MANAKNDSKEDVKEKKDTKTKENTIKISTKKIKDKIKQIRDLDREEYILVMNNTSSNLYFSHPNCLTTLDMYNYGDVQDIKIGELMTMKSTNPRILNDGWLIILDDDVVNAMGLSKLYENIITLDNIEELINKSNKDIENILSKAPKIVKENIGRYVIDKIKNNEWESMSKKNSIEKALGTSLTYENV